MMTDSEVFIDMKKRTEGEIYIGVVGPVRSGKSTFIKRFAEKMILPFLTGEEKERLQDELPQSASGKTVMTTEPKFVPEKAAVIAVGESKTRVSVRLVDCVGFPIAGAVGFEEEGTPRLVNTPWSEQPLSFERAAELGTERVIREHSTIGVLVTSDGSFSDLPRESYESAEERTVRELKAIDKPFVVLLNTKDPSSSAAHTLAESLKEKYECSVLPVNCLSITEKEIAEVLSEVLFEFPVSRMDFTLPEWMRVLPEKGEILSGILSVLKSTSSCVKKMRDCFRFENAFSDSEYLQGAVSCRMDLGEGVAQIGLQAREGVFYEVLGKECGEDLSSDTKLLRFVRELSAVKREYDKISQAFEEAKANGYGVALPDPDDMLLSRPESFKDGNSYGVKIKAVAHGYHVVRVDINGEISPLTGGKEQSEEFFQNLSSRYEEEETAVWQTEFFGKSVKQLMCDDLAAKTSAMSVVAQRKLRRGITKMVNEGKGNLVLFVF